VLKSLNIRQKLGIVICLFMVPVCLLGFLFVRQAMKDIAFAEAERAGIVYAQSLGTVYFGLQKLASGLEPGVDLKAAAQLLGQAGPQFNASMNIEQSFKALMSLATTIRQPDALNPQTLTDAEAARDLLRDIGDGSNLILDPDLDSYYLMDLSIIRLPDLAEAVRDVSRAAAESERRHRDGLVTDSDVVKAIGRLQDSVRELRNSAGRAIKGNTTGYLAGQFTTERDRFEASLQALLGALEPISVQATEEVLDRKAFDTIHNTVRAQLETIPGFWGASNAALDDLLVMRTKGFWRSLIIAMSLSGITMVGALLLALVYSRSIMRSIRRLSTSIDAVTAGDLDGRIAAIDDRTEIGIIARSVENLRLATVDKLNGEHLRDRDEAIMAKTREAAGTIAEELRSTIIEAIGDINRLASAMGLKTIDLSKSSSNGLLEMGGASDRLETTTHSLSTVSAMITEFSQSIGDITAQAERYVSVAEEASQGSQMVSMNVKDLINATAQIGAMVDTISGIANQTNLLALNATIEAARAGEAGRGFSVVAAEVKALAKTTSDATSNITQQIRSIEMASNSFSATVTMINDTIVSLSEISSAIAVAIAQQKEASIELDQTVHSVANDAGEVNRSVTAVVTIARNVGSQASDIDALAQELARRTIGLQEKADSLIFKLQAA
jgi:methyl-accepting chemotaxis protein